VRKHRIATVAVLLGLSLAVSAPALAFDPPGGNGGGDDDTSSGTGASYDNGEPATDQVRNCSIVSSPSYLGVACGSAKGGDGPTIREILDGDPLPECWHEPLTESELAALGHTNDEDSVWYWERCLEGIDPKTLKVGDEGVSFTVGLVSLDPAETVTLTPNQQDLVEFQGKDGQIPAPFAAVSPTAHPRVGAWVSFFNGTDREVTVDAGTVALRATVDRIEVQPLGEGLGDAVSCPGIGHKAVRGDSPDTHPNACWYKYEQSSAAEPDQKYPAVITAYWSVNVSEDGGATWRYFNSFSKSQVTTIPVTEIQALVIR
jgi:hypothetical protein